MAVQIILRVWEFVLIGITLLLLAISQKSLNASLPVHKVSGKEMAAARLVLNTSWVLLGTDVLQFLFAVRAMLFEKEGGAAGAGGSGGAVSSCRAAAR
jgi:hypothetical protein